MRLTELTRCWSQFFLASQDTYFTYHLFSQMELLPGWASMAIQRVGDVGGPLSYEFELEEQELDW